MNSLLIITILSFFLVVGIVILSPYNKNHIRSRNFQLFRVLFPSWRFFEDTYELPKMFLRIKWINEPAFGEWEPCLEVKDKNLLALFINPEGNLFLSSQNLITQAVSDMQEVNDNNPNAFLESTSYKLLNNLAQYYLMRKYTDKNLSDFEYQFKLCNFKPPQYLEPAEDILISLAHNYQVNSNLSNL